MLRTLTPWTARLPRNFGEFDAEFPKWVSRVFGPEQGMLTTDMKFLPEVNVLETEKAVEVTAELPGMKPEDVKLELRDGQLWITGEKK